MKTKVLSLIFIFSLSSVTLIAGVKTESFKVAGNCGMCKDRIEEAANSVEGVSEAIWNKETMMIEVTFDAEKTDIMDIHKAIAKSGHDTNKVTAKDKVYKKLPKCCKYERLEEKKTSSCCDNPTSGCGGK